MTLYYNSHDQRLIWGTLTHPGNEAHQAGTTLDLEPGEEVELDLVPNTAPEGEPPNGFEDPFLKPVAAQGPSAAPSFYTPPTQAAPPADSPQE